MKKLIPLYICTILNFGCSSISHKNEFGSVDRINEDIVQNPTAAGTSRTKSNTPPRAKFKTDAVNGVTPFSVNFDASRSRDWDGNIVSYDWDFGNNSTTSGKKVIYQFTSTGSFTVTLTVTDNKGATSSATTEITVISPHDSPATFNNRPTGIYSIDRIVDLPYVSGVAKRVKWSEIEPQEGVYNFSEIEKIINDAELIGQSVTIATRLTSEPDWLMGKIPEDDKYTGVQGIDIAPWNETMLQALDNLVFALSNHIVDGIPLADHPAVKQINASIGTMSSIRMKTTPNNYTPELLKQSVSRSISMWSNAFPDKHIYVGLFGVKDGTQRNTTELSTEAELRNELLEEFNGFENSKINFFIEFWTGQQPSIDYSLLHDVKDTTSIMMQACGSWVAQDTVWEQCGWVSPFDSPEQGFNYAMDNFNTTYFEVYQNDLNHPDYYEQFDEAAYNIQNLSDSLN